LNSQQHLPISEQMLVQARQQALADGRLVVEVLEELHGGTPEEFISA